MALTEHTMTSLMTTQPPQTTVIGASLTGREVTGEEWRNTLGLGVFRKIPGQHGTGLFENGAGRHKTFSYRTLLWLAPRRDMLERAPRNEVVSVLILGAHWDRLLNAE